MKETKTITLKNDAILIRLEPALKARLLEYAGLLNKSAASVVRGFIDYYAQPKYVRKSKARKSA